MPLNDFYQLFIAHKDSNLSTENFLQKYSKEITKVRIGCSFNPEHWIFEHKSDSPLSYVESATHSDEQKDLIMRAAKFIVGDLKIKDIRLSIRWSKVYKDGEIDFGYYDSLFKYFFSQDVNICLNIGPIKTMRWPEEQVPVKVLEILGEIPTKGKVLTPSDELAKVSRDYLKQMLKFLKEKFTQDQLLKITSFQADNEAFNKFGEYGWTFSEKLEASFIKLIDKELPNRQILLNSSGRNDMLQNLDLVNRTSIPIKRFIFGYNYYYKVPGQSHFPLRYLDNINLSFPFSISTSNLKRLSISKGFAIEISELQGEPWMHIKSPGNSVKEFRFTLLRSIISMLNLQDERNSIIRYWGIEDIVVKKLADKNTKEHEEIFNIIRKINQ